MIKNISPSLELCLFQLNASIYVTCSYKKIVSHQPIQNQSHLPKCT